MIKVTPKRRGRLRLLIRAEPMLLPTGIIPISVPKRKRLNPMIIKKPPKAKRPTLDHPTGAIVNWRITTMIINGTTERDVSFNFFNKFKLFSSKWQP